ncbi:MAG TPA: hypothetical protein VG816_13250 [Solirubrobacterales bacterium]|nr:hypothetical protein [Solirubrobacterales bacterium]
MRREIRGWRALAAAGVLTLMLAPGATASPLRGRVDRSFGDGGRVTFRLGPTFAHSAYTAMVRQPDGSILLLGNTELVKKSRYGKFVEAGGFVQRRLPNGTLDPGFREVLEDERISGLAQQADGNVLYAAGGEFQSQVHRLDASGVPDSSYGTSGVSASIPLGARFLAVDDQGRTIVAGDTGVGGNCHDCQPKPVAAVARLLPNGALDKSFGKEGMLLLPAPHSEWAVTGLAIEPGGSIVVGSETAIFGVTPEGQPSPAFGDGGTVPIDGGVGAITQASSGDLIVATNSAQFCCGKRGSVVVHAFLADGHPDSSWASGGEARIAVADVNVPTALAPAPEGGVMLAGESAVANEPKGCSVCHYTPYVTRLTGSGAVDPGFAAQLTESPGTFRNVGPTQGYTSRVAAIVVAPDGQVLLAGKGEAVEQATVAALSPSGAPEPAFGVAGFAADPQPLPSETGAQGLALGPRGRLVVAYGTNAASYSRQSRLGGWAGDGAPLQGYGGDAEIGGAFSADLIEADGRGRVYGVEEPFRASDRITRFGRDGRPDLGYGTEGKALLPKRFDLKQLVVRRSGAILAVGRIAGQNPMALFELTPAGRPNRHFGRQGLARIRWGKDEKAVALAASFDRRGRVVLFGLFGRTTPLARLLPNGQLDRSFGDLGRLNFKPLVYLDFDAVSVARDGSIYLATSGENGDATVARFGEDGALDRSFGRRGVLRVDAGLPLVRLFTGGRQLVLVLGEGRYGGSGFDLRAYHLDGRPDLSFGDRGSISHSASTFAPVAALRQRNGRLVLAGTRGPLEAGEYVELLRFR